MDLFNFIVLQRLDVSKNTHQCKTARLWCTRMVKTKSKDTPHGLYQSGQKYSHDRDQKLTDPSNFQHQYTSHGLYRERAGANIQALEEAADATPTHIPRIYELPEYMVSTNQVTRSRDKDKKFHFPQCFLIYRLMVKAKPGGSFKTKFCRLVKMLKF